MRKLLTLFAVCVAVQAGVAQSIDADDVAAARQALQQARQAIGRAQAMAPAQKLEAMIGLGMWQQAAGLLDTVQSLPPLQQLPYAHYLILNNDFFQAEQIVNQALKQSPASVEAALLKAQLYIQAWQLKEAEALCLKLLARHPQHAATATQLGRVYMYQKHYDKGLALARQVQQWQPTYPHAYLLEADLLFWKQQPEKAEAPLRKCLELNPFDADARFAYGYAIWRRVDATQLKDMAAQWELALEIHPLHYLTHWHWGNGHTHLTFPDYQDPQEDEIRGRLARADSLISQNQMQQALQVIAAVEKAYPESVLPAMHKGSAYYMAYDLPYGLRLDSAQHIFQRILQRKPHYGPAHNGLAAVIKARRFPYLAAYDSLEQVIADVHIPPEQWPVFTRVFPDMTYYPGQRVPNMVWAQLYSSKAYLPMLARLGREFVIPPLHIDLALAMKSAYFRGNTTFDNRQWMDIRGVGSGATGIEYVERAAHLERNVTLHEYVHLFHGTLFTDAEMREVRKRYYYAMEHGLTLDYYSANNEFEYLAQTYPAYFIPIKVHPLNHKSVNTTRDLKQKDPLMYAFIDELVNKEQAFLEGDEQALAGNWAQAYLQLANQAMRRRQYEEAALLLDTALNWDAAYVPAMLQYARLEATRGHFEEAEGWLKQARKQDEFYAPTYMGYAALTAARMRAGQLPRTEGIRKQIAWYDKAWKMEKDLAVRADINREFRRFYLLQARLPDALQLAEAYLETAPTISTYLRDRRDETQAFIQLEKGKMGYPEAVDFFRELVSRKPQHYHHRLQYAQVLVANGQVEEAIRILAEAQRILTAAGNPSLPIAVALAEYACMQGIAEAPTAYLAPFAERLHKAEVVNEQLLRVYACMGEKAKANEMLTRAEPGSMQPYELAEWEYSRGVYERESGEEAAAEAAFQAAVQANPYHFAARLALARLWQAAGRHKQVNSMMDEMAKLPIPPGPAWQKRFEEVGRR